MLYYIKVNNQPKCSFLIPKSKLAKEIHEQNAHVGRQVLFHCFKYISGLWHVEDVSQKYYWTVVTATDKFSNQTLLVECSFTH